MPGLSTRETPPADDLLELVAQPAAFAWVRRGDGLVGWGAAHEIDPGTGPARFARAADALRAWFAEHPVPTPLSRAGSAGVAFVSFTFDATRAGSALIVPEVLVGRAAGVGWTTAPAPPPTDAQPLPPVRRVRYAGSSISEVAWLEAVAAAADAIQAGRLDKVVLARDLQVWTEQPVDLRLLARNLAARFPDCYTFLHRDLVGATPELLLRRSGRAVGSLVLAGSAPRGRDAAEDHRVGEALQGSAKDRAEHALSVASVRTSLEPFCASLSVDATPWLLRLDNVMHLATAVRGVLGAPAHLLTLADALHPTAAVCGTPSATAQALLTRLERMDRGRYAGPVGWVDAAGDGELGIALRCAEFAGTRGRLFAGAGIMAGSLPEAELEETRLKLRAMQSALADS